MLWRYVDITNSHRSSNRPVVAVLAVLDSRKKTDGLSLGIGGDFMKPQDWAPNQSMFIEDWTPIVTRLRSERSVNGFDQLSHVVKTAFDVL